MTQRVAIHRLRRHHVAHQLTRIALCRRTAQHHRMRHRLLNAGLGAQRMIDFVQLNALTADLQLVIAASEILHRTVIQPARNVAGQVHALASGVRVGDKAAGGQLRPVEIAVRQLNAGKIEIAGHARRHRLHLRIKNAQTGVPHREADRYAWPIDGGERRAIRRIPADINGRFGWPIQIVQRHAGQCFPAARQIGGQCFTAAEHIAQAGAARYRGRVVERRDKGRQHRGYEMRGGDFVAGKQLL